jgi:hypothetical protein
MEVSHMLTQCEAIIEAFITLGGIHNKQEKSEWVTNKYGAKWKDFGTPMADMVPVSYGGNKSSLVPSEFRVLQRISLGKYALVHQDKSF